MALEGLSAEITADTSDYIAGLEVAEQQTEDLGDEATRVAAKMRLLEGRVDEAGDEMTETAAEATVAGAALSTLSFSTGRATTAFLGLSVAATGSALPAIGALTLAAIGLAGAIGAIATAVIALTGTFGLLLGAGVITQFDRLQQTLDSTARRIKAALRPLGRVFGPLLQQAIRALPRLVRNIVNALGNVRQFRNALADIGGLLMQLVPAIVAVAADISRALLPAIRRITAFLDGRTSTATSEIARSFRGIADDIGRLVVVILDLLPSLIRFGATVLEAVTPALTLLITGLDVILESINNLTAAVGKIGRKFKPLIDVFRAVGQAALFAAQAIAQLQAFLPGGNPANRVGAIANVAQTASAVPTADPTAGTGSRRRNEAARGNPGARDGGLPPIEVKGDTGVVEDVAFQAADDRVSREERRSRGLNRRRR